MKKINLSAVCFIFVILSTFFGCQKYPNITKVIKNDFNNHYEAVNWFAFYKENGINSVSQGGDSIIVEAAETGNLNLVKATVKDGATVNLYVKQTAVYAAARNRFYDIVDYLLKQNASPYVYDAQQKRYNFDLIQLGVLLMDLDLLELVVPYYSLQELDFSVDNKPKLFERGLGFGLGGSSVYVSIETVEEMILLLDYLSSSKIKLSYWDLDTLAGNITYINNDIRNYDITPMFVNMTKKVLEYYLTQDSYKRCLEPNFNWDDISTSTSRLQRYINTMRN